MNRCIILIISLLLIGCEKEEIKTERSLSLEPKAFNADDAKAELLQIDTINYLEEYIEKIINEGSYQNLGFPTKTMDAGLAHTMDAKDIARYVITLRKQKSSDDNCAKKAAIFYTSNCGGCHGNDGKGLGGIFPDLTREPMLGIEIRKEFLLSKLRD